MNKRIPALTASYIARNNLRHRKFRSASLIALIAVTTFIFAGGSLLGYSMQNGVESAYARLGADALIVPLEAENEAQGALLNGTPSTFFIEEETAALLMEAEGVQRSSAHLYVGSMNSSHCAYLVQIVVYDPATDFIVAPWLERQLPGGSQRGEVIVGNNLFRDVGDGLKLYGSEYKVAGRLEKTGMGFDNSVFISFDTAESLLRDYEEISGDTRFSGDKRAVSAIFVDTTEDVTPYDFKIKIINQYRGSGVQVILSQQLIGDIAENMRLTILVLATLLAALWGLTVFVLSIVYAITLNERRREFGILRAIGATRKKLAAIILSEAAITGAVGAGLGIGLLCLVFFPFNGLIAAGLDTAYLLPETRTLVLILLAAFAVGSATTTVASVFSAVKIGRSDSSLMMRESS